MSIGNYAIVNSLGVVTNIIVLDLEANPGWDPGEGNTLVNVTEIQCAIGWNYKDGLFINPNQIPEPSKDNLYDAELNDINQNYDVEKKKLALAFLNALLFDGQNEDDNKISIQATLVELNAKYDNDISLLDEKYGDTDA